MEIKQISPKQMTLWNWWLDPRYKDTKAIIADGSIRTGKTLFMSSGFVFWSMEIFNETNFGMAGKTIASLRRNVIKPLISLLRKSGYKVIERRADNMLIISYGNKTNYYYLFGGKDESSQDLVQGISCGGFYFDEVALMPQSFVNQATGRALTYPNRRYWFNCNPSNPFHYFKTEWIDKLDKKQAVRKHFVMQDNPILSDKDIKEASNMYSGAFYRRYILGEWVAADGLVYPNFDKDTMVIEKKPDNVRFVRYSVSVDYGIYHPMVYLLNGLGNDGVLYPFRLYYFDGSKAQVQKDDQQYADDFTRFLNGIEPSKIIIDPSASSFIQALKQRGYKQLKKANNDVNNGIRLVQSRMNEGKIKFIGNLKMLYKEMTTYAWDPKAAERGEDKVIKKMDHCLTGDTLVDTENGPIQISKLVEKRGKVYCYDEENDCKVISSFKDVRITQHRAKIYKLSMENGDIIRGTYSHPVLTKNGWKKLGEITDKDEIVRVKVNG
jgi:PBSX family phage terminase large subunit